MSPVRSTDKKLRDKAAHRARVEHVKRMVRSLQFYATEGDDQELLVVTAQLHNWLDKQETK